MPPPTISVVVATHQRRDLCRRAVASALAQRPSPLEVLVAVDGSTDGTREMLEEWGLTEPRLRVLPDAPSAGRPAPPRNRAIDAARGTWLAFLDDDDEWLPGKLAAQAPYLNDEADVVAANAQTPDGAWYFPRPPAVVRPPGSALLRGNPIILSTALSRRELVLAIGRFEEEPWLAGIEDYALWLALADAGARFVILGEPLVRYADHGTDRLSHRTATNELAVARLFWRRWRARPGDRALRRAAFSRASYALTVSRQALIGR